LFQICYIAVTAVPIPNSVKKKEVYMTGFDFATGFLPKIQDHCPAGCGAGCYQPDSQSGDASGSRGLETPK
jgi:hypothetical protein